MTKLFIGGLNGEVQEMDIAILVSLHGELKSIKVVRDRKTAKCKGYAFLETATEKDASNIIEALDQQKFQRNIITVKRMDDQDAKTSKKDVKPKRIR